MEMSEMQEQAREKLQEYVTISQSGGSIDLEQLGSEVNELLDDWKGSQGVVVVTDHGLPIHSVKFDQQGDTIVMRTNGGW